MSHDACVLLTISNVINFELPLNDYYYLLNPIDIISLYKTKCSL